MLPLRDDEDTIQLAGCFIVAMIVLFVVLLIRLYFDKKDPNAPSPRRITSMYQKYGRDASNVIDYMLVKKRKAPIELEASKLELLKHRGVQMKKGLTQKKDENGSG